MYNKGQDTAMRENNVILNQQIHINRVAYTQPIPIKFSLTFSIFNLKHIAASLWLKLLHQPQIYRILLSGCAGKLLQIDIEETRKTLFAQWLQYDQAVFRLAKSRSDELCLQAISPCASGSQTA